MRTVVKFWIALIYLISMGCHSPSFKEPTKEAKGYIDLKEISFCSALGFNDSAMKHYVLSPPSTKAQDIFEQIQEYSGIKMNVSISQGKVPNALATIIEDKKVIIYNEEFINDIDKLSRTFFWQSIFIIAHECGHLLNNHQLASDKLTRYKQELQADEFAGFILYRMGADIDTSSWIMKTAYLQTDSEKESHPPRKLRTEAIYRGWKKGYVQSFNIPVPPPPHFDEKEYKEFTPQGFYDCQELLGSESLYSYHSDLMDGCSVDRMITKGERMIDYFTTDSIVGPGIYRDTMIGVIMGLDNDLYEHNLGGMLEQADIRVRIFQYNRLLNPLFNNYNLYVTGLKNPRKEEGYWNYFTKTVKPGQWIKFKVIVENSTSMFNTYRFSYLEFIPPPREVANSIILSPFSKNIPK